MNYELMENIIRHVMAKLVIIPSSFIDIDIDKSKSLLSKDFLLKEKLTFEGDNGAISNNIWGCQISSQQQEIKILVGDCSIDEKEYCLLVQLKDAPAYGLYIVNNYTKHTPFDSEPMIAVSINNKDWMECSTYLQATFLAGMEQIKDLGLSWNKCSNYSEHYKLMLDFIKFHNEFYEDFYARQED